MFKKYDKYNYFEDNWFKEIPEQWDIKRFIDLFSFNKGLSITKDNLQDEGIPCISYGEIHSKYGFEIKPERDELKCVSIDYLKTNKQSLLKYGDFIFADTSEDIQGAGNFTYLNSNSRIFAGYHTVITKPKFLDNHRYIAYLFNSLIYRSQIQSSITGIKVYSITKRILKSTQLLIPKTESQIQISNYLDENTLKIDKTIELLETKKSNYIELKQRVIFETVTKGLSKNNNFKDSEINWVGEIPINWAKDRLKNIFNERSVRNLDKKTGEPITTNILSVMKDIGVINHRDKGLVGNKMSEDITGYKIVHPNDIVVNKMNVIIGSVGISKEFGALSVVYIILITKADSSPRYYDYVFRVKAFQKSLRKIATGILEIREAVDMNLFKGLELPKPPKEEQIEIANYLDEKTSKIDEIVKTIDENIDRLKEYRKVLINDTVTGKIKVI